MSDLQRLERRALKFSVAGAIIMAALGLGFAYVTDSEAILLDGLFSLVGFFVGLVSLRIATLVQQPDDEHFHFGYNNFEPFFNVVKGVIIAIVGILALISAVYALLHGGREINTGYAVIYAIVVSIGSFSVWGLQRAAARTTGSPLVVVDAKNWLVDGCLTVGVLIAFSAAWLMQGTSWDWAINYVDPAVVALLVIVIIPVPYIIIRDSLNEVLLGAPSMEIQKQVQDILLPELEEINASDYQVRMVKVGRALYVDVYMILEEEHPACHIPEQDRIREHINVLLARDIPHVTADVSFTLDAKWAGFIRDIGEPWAAPWPQG